MDLAFVVFLVALVFGILIFFLLHTIFPIDLYKDPIADRVFYDEKGSLINHKRLESTEQSDAFRYIDEGSKVLELGGCYGTVTTVISHKLKHSGQQVVVEINKEVIRALKDNLNRNNSNAIVINKIIGGKNGCMKKTKSIYGTQIVYDCIEGMDDIDSIEIDELEKQVGFKFDTLVADCEGCLEEFVKHCIEKGVWRQFKTIMYEADGRNINYKWIDEQIASISGMKKIKEGFHNVWKVSYN